MGESEFHVEGEVRRNGVVATVTGSVDIATAGEFERAIRALLGPANRNLAIDMAKCEHFDSTGMRVLVTLDQLTRARAGTLVLHRPSVMVRSILELTGLTAIRTDDRPPPP